MSNNVQKEIVFIFTEIRNRWSTEVEFKHKINVVYLLVHYVFIYTASANKYSSPKRQKHGMVQFLILLFIDMCNKLYTTKGGSYNF